jgi:DHA1 family inner membrane transport protein
MQAEATNEQATEHAETTEKPLAPRTFVELMSALTLSHLTVNIVRRFAYPFLPAISRLLGVPLVEVQNVVALQAGVGVFSPALGGWLEPYSRKRVMIGMLIIMALFSFLGVLVDGFMVFAIVMIILGIGKIVFQPALMAYLGEKVSFQRRGMAVGISELSWPLAMLVAAPVTGFLLGGDNGLRWVFALMTVSFIFGAILLQVFLPYDQPHPDAKESADAGIGAIFPVLKRNPHAIGALMYPFFLVIANEMFYINYGTFMEISFELVLTALGAVSVVIAFAEMTGGFGVIGLSDRIGKRRFTLFGATGAALMYLILPLLSSNLILAMAGLFVMFFFTEIAIVASLALYTEVVPEARNVFMSANVASHSIGRLVGGVIGAQAYALLGDFMLLGIVASLIGALAVFFLWYFVRIEG